MPRITKPIRVEQSYYDKINAWALEGKRGPGQQVELLADFYEARRDITEQSEPRSATNPDVMTQLNQQLRNTTSQNVFSNSKNHTYGPVPKGKK